MRRTLGALAAAVAALAAASVVPASAADAASGPAPASRTTMAPTDLVMTKTGTVNKRVTLQCQPAGGTHPTPDDACTKLTAVNGQFMLLTPAPGYFCTADYNPVTVTGYWQLRQVYFSKTYSNDCEAAVGSNFVFRF